MPDYSEINSLMNHYGERIVEKAMSNLGVYRIVNGKKRRAVATDTLRRSLAYSYTQDGNMFTLSFFAKGKAAQYAGVVEYGRKPDSKMPPVDAIMEWMRVKRIPFMRDGKVIKATEEMKRSRAFIIARSIAKKGTRPLFYWRDAQQDVIEEFKNDFVETLRGTIVTMVNNEITNELRKNGI